MLRLLTHSPLRLALVAAALLLSGSGPAAAPGTRSNIDDLHPWYVGHAVSTNGANEQFALDLFVLEKDGKNFEGSLDAIEILGGVTPQGPTAFPTTGSVSPKGKFKMSFSPEKGLTVTMKGVLSDGGILIVGTYSGKEGRRIVERGLFRFRAPS